MTTGRLSATPEEVDAVGTTLEAQVGIVDTIKSDVNRQLANAAWTGGKKDAFQDQWTNVFVPALDELNVAFAETGRNCHTIAENTRIALG